MEQWEIEYRAKLEKELPEQLYRIDDLFGETVAYTGKAGYIDYCVEMRRGLQDWGKGKGLREQIPAGPFYEGKLNMEKLDKYLDEVFKSEKKKK